MSTPLQKPEGINWSPASVELPDMPMIQPGEDAMSATIAAVLPAMAADMTTNVVSLQAKEGMFSGKVDAAQSAYQNTDDQGHQSVGQMGQMLGQLGQMGQQAGQMAGQAGGPLGQLGQMSQFGSMMQQAMQGKSGEPGQAGQGAPGQAGQGAPGQLPQPDERQTQQDGRQQQQDARQVQQDARQQQQDNRQTQQDRRESQQNERDSHQQHPAVPPAAAGPGSSSHQAGPAPVAPVSPPRHGGDVSREM